MAEGNIKREDAIFLKILKGQESADNTDFKIKFIFIRKRQNQKILSVTQSSFIFDLNNYFKCSLHVNLMKYLCLVFKLGPYLRLNF